MKLEEELEKDRISHVCGKSDPAEENGGGLQTSRWVADYEDGLRKVYYRENIVARIICHGRLVFSQRY